VKYRAEIDGLRAIAVLPVIFFHGGVSGFTGGFVGVDIFFVISGYLITTIILNDLENGKFSLAKFYERRARRILPALSVVVLCCIPFAWIWMLPQELEAFGKSLVASALFSSNVLFWIESGYFDAAAELKPLLHTWSLGIEEQFYLLFPVVFALVWRWRKSAVLAALILFAFASLLVAEWGSRNAPSANFFLLPSRVWELLVGAIVAVRFNRTNKQSEVLGLLGMGMIILAVLFFDSSVRMPSLWSLLPVTGAALVLGFAHSGTVVARLLSLKVLVGVGLVSYSAYLWHQPLLAFTRIRNEAHPSEAVLIWLFIATFVLAWLTWRFIEQPFRGGGGLRAILPARHQVVFASCASIAAMILIGTMIFFYDRFGTRYAASGATFKNVENFKELLAPNFGLNPDCDAGKFTLSRDCRTTQHPIMALWGDSYAMHLVQALKSSASSVPFIQLTLSQCGPIPDFALQGSILNWGKCIEFNDQVLNYILAEDSLKIVVISSPFDQLKDDLYQRNGELIRSTSERKEKILKRLSLLREQLAAAGKHLVIVSPPPRTGRDLGLCYSRQMVLSGQSDKCDFPLSMHHTYSAHSIELLNELEKAIPVIQLEQFICNTDSCRVTFEDTPLYRDQGHFSVKGSHHLGEKIDLMSHILNAATFINPK
jgi:peptidoglycan/LPS O-acetylase OafA/YrhL